MKWFMRIVCPVMFVGLVALPCQTLAARITETTAAIGENCDASGDNSTAMGYLSTASGPVSTAMGYWTTASASCSTAMGRHTEASGGYSTVIGYGWSYSYKLVNDVPMSFMVGYMANGYDTVPELFVKDGGVGIGTKSPKCLIDVRREKTSFDTSDISDLNLLVANNASSLSGGKAAIGFSVSNSIDSQNVFGAMITHTPEGSYSNGGLEFWTKDTDTSTMTLTEKMRIDREGNVGIGTTNPNYRLEVNGSAGKLGGGTWADSSDERLKTNINELDSNEAFDKITRLRGVTLEWINTKEHGEGLKAGILAQELEVIFPDWVEEVQPTGRDKGLVPQGEKVKAISFPHDFNAYLIEAIKELKAQNEKQQAEIEELRSIIKELKS